MTVFGEYVILIVQEYQVVKRYNLFSPLHPFIIRMEFLYAFFDDHSPWRLDRSRVERIPRSYPLIARVEEIADHHEESLYPLRIGSR